MTKAGVRTTTLPAGDLVPVLGQGTWGMAEGARPLEDEAAALNLGLDLGMTLLDTAEMYADGAAEELVGQPQPLKHVHSAGLNCTCALTHADVRGVTSLQDDVGHAGVRQELGECQAGYLGSDGGHRRVRLSGCHGG